MVSFHTDTAILSGNLRPASGLLPLLFPRCNHRILCRSLPRSLRYRTFHRQISVCFLLLYHRGTDQASQIDRKSYARHCRSRLSHRIHARCRKPTGTADHDCTSGRIGEEETVCTTDPGSLKTQRQYRRDRYCCVYALDSVMDGYFFNSPLTAWKKC